MLQGRAAEALEKVSHTTILKDLCNQGKLNEALTSLKRFLRTSQYENLTIEALKFGEYASLLNLCSKTGSLIDTEFVHTHLIKSQRRPNTFLYNTLINAYAKCGNIQKAQEIFQSMRTKNVFTYTIMVSKNVEMGFDNTALDMYKEMVESGVPQNEFTASSALRACAGLGFLEDGLQIHNDICRHGFDKDTYVGSALVDMYGKCGKMELARHVFDKMPAKNSVSWHVLVAGYVSNGELDEAKKVFETMPERNTESYNVMILGYGKAGNVKGALDVFQNMPKRDVVSWTQMIAAFMHNGHVDDGLGLFWRSAEKDVVMWNAVLSGLVKNKRVRDASIMFDEMPERNCVSWNVMISGFAETGLMKEGLGFYRDMRNHGIRPRPQSFVGVFPVCSSMAAMEHGRMIHGDVVKCGYEANIHVGNSVIDFYSKCGSLEDACQVFASLKHKKDVVSWTLMVIGFASHGHVNEALGIFEEMKILGPSPDSVAFVGALMACARARLVGKGLTYFEEMYKVYKIEPSKEHYCCMVHLLGRDGHSEEAKRFINKMPMAPDPSIWKALLSSCRFHSNLPVAEFSAKQLFQLEPKNIAAYVLLSHVYASFNRWDDIENLRRRITAIGVKSRAGCSWIEANKQIYLFASGDDAQSFPYLERIYSKLKVFSWQINEAGYAPAVRKVSIVEEEENSKYKDEHGLIYHSEMLALAFGLLYANPRTTIRITKNVRMCTDCHSAMMFISRYLHRKIMIRDANQFHHFVDGECSCGEHW